MGNFLRSIAERLSFLTTSECYAEETPCSWDYTPKEVLPKKWKKGWVKAVEKPIKKSNNGPGKYTDGIEKAYKNILNSPIIHSFSRSNSPSPISKHAEITKFVPGVGSYTNLERAYTRHQVIKKERTTLILPYKIKGFADDLIKHAKEVPGPGAYEIGPPSKIY